MNIPMPSPARLPFSVSSAWASRSSLRTSSNLLGQPGGQCAQRLVRDDSLIRSATNRASMSALVNRWGRHLTGAEPPPGGPDHSGRPRRAVRWTQAIPSRMSASETIIVRGGCGAGPGRGSGRRQRSRRPGRGACTAGAGARGHRHEPLDGAARRETAARTGRWRRGRTPGRSSTAAATVVIVPATHDGRRARASTGHASRWASMSATQPATSSAVGGSECRCRSCRRTEPMSIECADSGASVPRISSVDPPPMSTTSTGLGRRPQVADRAVVRERRLLGPGDHLGSDAQPLADPLANTSPLAASRVAEVAQNRIRSGGPAVRRDQCGVLVDRRERPLERLVGQPAGPVHALAQPDQPHLAHRHVRQLADQQLDGVGAAVDRGDRPAHGARGRTGGSTSTHGPGPHHSPSSSSTSSPRGFTPGPWASDWRPARAGT